MVGKIFDFENISCVFIFISNIEVDRAVTVEFDPGVVVACVYAVGLRGMIEKQIGCEIILKIM